MRYGKQITGKTLIIPVDYLKTQESVIGEIYELTIQTNGVSDPQQVINSLVAQIPQKFPDAKVLWVDIYGNTVRMQLQGSPFAWATLLLFLPQILSVIGVAIIAVGVFLVVGEVPSWAWAALGVGLTLFFLGPTIAKQLQLGKT